LIQQARQVGANTLLIVGTNPITSSTSDFSVVDPAYADPSARQQTRAAPVKQMPKIETRGIVFTCTAEDLLAAKIAAHDTTD